jgi:hypothetical protein
LERWGTSQIADAQVADAEDIRFVLQLLLLPTALVPNGISDLQPRDADYSWAKIPLAQNSAGEGQAAAPFVIAAAD